MRTKTLNNPKKDFLNQKELEYLFYMSWRSIWIHLQKYIPNTIKSHQRHYKKKDLYEFIKKYKDKPRIKALNWEMFNKEFADFPKIEKS